MKILFCLTVITCNLLNISPVKAMLADTTRQQTNHLADTLFKEKTTSKPDSLEITSQLKFIWGEECEAVLCNGMSENDYQQSKNISWITLINDGSPFKPEVVDLMKYTKYSDFEPVLSRLTRSPVCRVFYSSLSSTDGRKMFAVEIGFGNEVIILTAGIHARETANPQFLLKFASSLVNEFEKGDPGTKSLLTEKKIVILPCINPDGYSAVLEGKKVVQNKHLFIAGISDQQISDLKSNANGVDLNRSFPSYSAGICWKGIEKSDMLSTQPCCFYYPGKQLGFENETKVTISFLEKYLPHACAFVDLHSAGHVIYAGKPHLSDTFNIMARSLGKFIGEKTHYLLLGEDAEVTGLGADGTVTDFAAEIAAGFQYSPLTGRLMPPDWEQGKLIRKYNQTLFNVSIFTIETTATTYGKTTTKPTPVRQNAEWHKHNLLNALTSLASYSDQVYTKNGKQYGKTSFYQPRRNE